MEQIKLDKMRNLIKELSVDGILLTLQKNVSWFLEGRSHVNVASEAACCNVLITTNECRLIVNNIEAKRLLEEECESGSLFTSVDVWNWYEPGQRETLLQRLKEVSVIVHDVDIEPHMLQIRSVLDEKQQEKARLLGRLTSEAMEETAMRMKRGETEFQIAGRLAAACYERGLEPIVNLIAVDERIYLRRHPLPTNKSLDKYAMLVLCARSNGLIASATRLIYFGEIPTEIMRKMEAVVEIDARLAEASRPGKSLKELFTEMKQFYREAGYEQEYMLHHQGGLSGYVTRERIATVEEQTRIQKGQIYAWNPSITGVKSEDTILISDGGNEILTICHHFPVKTVKINSTSYVKPWILQRKWNC